VKLEDKSRKTRGRKGFLIQIRGEIKIKGGKKNGDGVKKNRSPKGLEREVKKTWSGLESWGAFCAPLKRRGKGGLARGRSRGQ